MNTDNPAGRLLHILKEGKDEAHHENCRNIWFKLLEVEDKNTALLMSRLGKVMQLPKQIVNQVKLEQSSVNDHWVQQVETAFSEQNLGGAWSGFITHIDEHTISYLTILASYENTQVLKAENLFEIREKINDLLTEVLEGDTNEHFKSYIVNYLRKIIVAIEEYKISGTIPIMESVEQTLGHALVDAKHQETLKTKIGGRILTTLGAVVTTVTTINDCLKLKESFQDLLGSM